MKERLKRKKPSPVLGILIILALLLGVVVLAAIIHVITDILYALGINAVFMQFVQYVLVIVLGVLIVRRYLTEYEYRLQGGFLIVDRYIGERPRNLLQIQTDHIISISKQPPEISRMERLTFKPKKSGVVYLVFMQDGKERAAYMSPSEKFFELLKEKTKL